MMTDDHQVASVRDRPRGGCARVRLPVHGAQAALIALGVGVAVESMSLGLWTRLGPGPGLLPLLLGVMLVGLAAIWAVQRLLATRAATAQDDAAGGRGGGAARSPLHRGRDHEPDRAGRSGHCIRTSGRTGGLARSACCSRWPEPPVGCSNRDDGGPGRRAAGRNARCGRAGRRGRRPADAPDRAGHRALAGSRRGDLLHAGAGLRGVPHREGVLITDIARHTPS
jgi:hypothetical protein